MKYSELEILNQAKRQVSHWETQKGKRIILLFMFSFPLILLPLLFLCFKQKFEISSGILAEDQFWVGSLFGLMISLILAVSVVGGMRMFSVFYGKDIAALRLLLRLAEHKSTDNNSVQATWD